MSSVASVVNFPSSTAKRIANQVCAGLRADRDGEVVISNGRTVARVYVCQGSVAWIHCSSRRVFLREILQKEAGLSDRDLHSVVEECRASGNHLGETLLEWNLVDRETLGSCLKKHVLEHLKELLAMHGPINAMFVPQERPYRMGLLFSWTELLTDLGQSNLLDGTSFEEPAESVNQDGRFSSMLAYALTQLPKAGAVGIVQLDPQGSQLVGLKRVDEFARDVLSNEASMIQELFEHEQTEKLLSLRDELRGHNKGGRYFRELIQTSEDHVHFLGRLHHEPNAVFVAVCHKEANLGMVLSKGRNICSMEPMG